MRNLFIFLVCFLTSNVFGQNTCNTDYALFNFDGKTNPKEINELGTSPQMDFLRKIKDPKIFIQAVFQNRKNPSKYKRDIEELDKVLKLIGFQNGINDEKLNENAIEYLTISGGTIGNLGSNSNSYKYSKLKNPKGYPAWKITSPTGCYFYIFTKCGNLFYPKNDCPPCPTVKCPTVTINYSADSKEINCVSQVYKKEVKIYVYAFHIYTKKQIVEEYQGKSGLRRIKRIVQVKDSILVNQNTMQIDVCNNENSHYEVSIEQSQVKENICKDTTIDLPVKLKLKGLVDAVSSTKQSDKELNSQSDKIIMIEFDEKTFESLKKQINITRKQIQQ